MATPALRVEGVSKRFRLYHEKYTTLKEKIIHMGNMPHEDLWALKDIDLEIQQGETVGLLGHNGSGKSTLLKCIAGIIQPTSGRILVRGKLAAMLELGAGMHPELSGRDNIYLNATLLGMSRRDVERKFDEIVAFAELEQFIDNQIRFYSSGMQSRLGFAVAVTFEPDVLLVDEVLAVGDENFQRKCLERIAQFQLEGRTIVLVTHSPDAVRAACSRAFVLNKGELVGQGLPGEVIRTYREYLMRSGEAVAEEMAALAELSDESSEESSVAVGYDGAGGPGEAPARRRDRMRVTKVTVEHPRSPSKPYIVPGEPVIVRVGYEAPVPMEDPMFSLAIYDIIGQLVYGCNTDLMGIKLGTLSGEGEVVFDLLSVPLLDGRFGISLGIQVGAEVHDWKEQESFFEVMSPSKATGQIALAVQVHLEPADGSEAPGEAGPGEDDPGEGEAGLVPAGALGENEPQ